MFDQTLNVPPIESAINVPQFCNFIEKHTFKRLLRTPFFLKHLWWCFCTTLPNVNQLRGIPRRFLPLVPEQLLCGTVPFQSNPFKLSIRLAIFLDDYFSEQLFFITPTQRSSYKRFPIKKAVDRKTHLSESLFNKHYKKETPTQVFYCKYCKVFKNIYFEEHL